MSTSTPPLNTAHQHATNADEFMAKGLLIPAADEHQKAADAFEACLDASNDENTRRTLRMLHNEHTRAEKELQRKIAALKEEGIDPTLPQKLTPPRPSPAAAPTAHDLLRHYYSQVDESFMLLGQQSTDAGDAFNTFWKAMEQLDYVAQPLAFATASLGLTESPKRELNRNGSYSSDTDTEGSGRHRRAFLGGRTKAQSPDGPASTTLDGAHGPDTAKSSHLRQSVIDIRNEFDEIAEEDYDSSDSFCFIPSTSEPSHSALKEENGALRSDLEGMQRRLESAERLLKLRQEQDQQLRENIAVARREAHRAMGASMHATQRTNQSTFDLTNLNLVPAPPPVVPMSANRDREAQLSRRVKELEEELRAVRVENEKQKAMIAKFRERWDKLKESARRKREAKAAAEAHNSPVHERIDEEPEAEAEQENR
ncbi:hypothetical protein F5148DRAFT_1299275 [Russula earlei]|uniref:Uncharacterized protein n=1 Tax=Russula earlei TaxID=71964 RepID=A0ACC0UA58_9AGAM|nr:hypothetical protein F5148DRAFT_1299275 [Russula earlei]